MDKTKDYLILLKKHHFWVICGVILIASLTSWFMAESRLDKEFKDQTTAIDGKFTAMKGISSTTNHPNDKVTDEMRKHVLGIADNVYEAWNIRYQEQQKVPQWQGDLSDAFLNFVKTKEPSVEIPPSLREEYQNFIRTEIETLFTQVSARNLEDIPDPTIPANQPGGAVRPQPGRPLPGRPLPGRPQSGLSGDASLGVTQEWKGMVYWDETLRQDLRDQYDWPRRPTSLQVRYANEDLWIYRALLDIIAKTNAGAKEHLLASIKQIEALNIGSSVLPPEEFYVPAVAAAGGEMGEGEQPASIDGGEGGGVGLEAPPAPGQTPGGEGGETGAGATLSPDDLVNANLRHLRYVDAKGNPLGYSAAEPFAEFKIMPFEMRLVMDQRKLAELLANAANSPLPVEVRQVAITSTEDVPAGAGGAGGDGGAGRGMPRGNMAGPGRMGGSRMPGGEGEGMGMGSGRMPPPRPNARQPRGGGDGGSGMGATDLGGAIELRPWDLHVEIRGVIYIFRKPDRTKVGKTEPAPEPAAAAAAPAEAGAGG